MGHLWPILGHFEHFGPNLAIWLHLENRTHAVGLKWHNQSMVVLYRMPYDIYWPSVVIQGGHWAHLWAILGQKWPFFTIYWPFTEVILIVLQLWQHQSMVVWYRIPYNIFWPTLGTWDGQGTNYGPFWGQKWPFSPYIDHLLKLFWLCCNCHKPREWKVGIWSDTTYIYIYWQSGVIQAGHWAQLWAILEPKNGYSSPYVDHLLLLSWWCCNYDKPRAWKVGIGYFDKVGSSRLATGPNYGPCRSQKWQFFTIYWPFTEVIWMLLQPWQAQSMEGWYRIPYNIFWQSGAIQAGHWAQLWAMLEQKIAIYHHMGQKLQDGKKDLCMSQNSPHSENRPGQTACPSNLPFWIIG